MQQQLLKTYFRFLIPAVLGFAAGFLNHTGQLTDWFQQPAESSWIVAVFVLALVFAVAAPIMVRTVFAHRRRERQHISESEFMAFERTLIRVALLSPYCAMIAYLYRFPEFYLAGSFLAALYAVYYFYPTRRRIQFEKRIFRVETDAPQ